MLSWYLSGKDILSWSQPACIKPGEAVHSLHPQSLECPELWWPMHLGEQVLLPVAHSTRLLHVVYSLLPCDSALNAIISSSAIRVWLDTGASDAGAPHVCARALH